MLHAHVIVIHGQAQDAGSRIDHDGNDGAREAYKQAWTPAGAGSQGRKESSTGPHNEYAEESEEVFESPGEVMDSLEELLQEQAHLFSEDELGLQHDD